jgi:hypothetical protein
MKDTDYTFGTRDDLPGGEDNRMQYRLTARASVSLELEARYPELPGTPETSGRQLVCGIRDLSASGFRLLSGEQLEAGALLPASVSMDNQSEPFALMVEVIWCRPDGADYLVGLKIIESDQTAYVEWIDAVATALKTT